MSIEPEKLPHLFDMFFQAESGRERRDSGSGIGLTLARRLIEMHGGTIEAKSDGLGKGSEFLVRLSIIAVELDAPPREIDFART